MPRRPEHANVVTISIALSGPGSGSSGMPYVWRRAVHDRPRRSLLTPASLASYKNSLARRKIKKETIISSFRFPPYKAWKSRDAVMKKRRTYKLAHACGSIRQGGHHVSPIHALRPCSLYFNSIFQRMNSIFLLEQISISIGVSHACIYILQLCTTTCSSRPGQNDSVAA